MNTILRLSNELKGIYAGQQQGVSSSSDEDDTSGDRQYLLNQTWLTEEARAARDFEEEQELEDEDDIEEEDDDSLDVTATKTSRSSAQIAPDGRIIRGMLPGEKPITIEDDSDGEVRRHDRPLQSGRDFQKAG